MGLMIKHSLKNIFLKPARLLLLVFCITFASFTALLALDMRNNIDSFMKGYMMEMLGKMDIMAYNTSEDIMDGLDEIAEYKAVGVTSLTEYEYERDPSGYEYSFERPIQVISLSDMDAAAEMAFIPESITIDDESAVVNKLYADKYGVSVGDTITLETRDEVELELKVVSVLNIKNTIISGESVLVSNETIRRISCIRNCDYNAWMIDVVDDAKSSKAAEVLRNNDPRAELEVVSEAINESDIQQIYNMFYLLFLISFLLVIFVTISIAEKIVNERMSVIGTLRSLGVTQGKTAFILLIENILYAAIGAGIGIFIYSKVKPVFLDTFMKASSSEGLIEISKYIRPTPLYIYLLILAGSILIECAYPLYELTKAVKTPIRDIIFDNKDTEFKYRFGRLYAGIVLAIVSVIAGFLVKNFFTLAVSLVCGVIALSVLIPFVIRGVSKALTAGFKKLSFPVAQLAAENISRNRIIMGTAVLCVTSLTLSILLGGIGEALSKDLSKKEYDFDLNASIHVNDDEHDYRYIEIIDGVEETDYIYSVPVRATLGDDKEKTITVASDTAHTMTEGIPEEGYGLAENEAVISSASAERLGLKTGDEIKLVLYPDTDFPLERSFVVRDIVDMEKVFKDGSGGIIINRDLYKHLFSDNLDSVRIRTADPEAVKKRIEKYSETSSLTVATKEELIEDDVKSSKALLTIMRAIVGGSAALTLIGIAGNQSLGFLTRKRETALLYSVALPRAGCRRLLFLESLFSMGISALVSAVTAPFLYGVLGHLLDVISDGDINILGQRSIGAAEIAVYLAAILAVFMMTTLIPAGYLRKMNIAEELKYE